VIAATSFAIIPEWLLDADVNPRAVVLYGLLRRYAAMPDGAHPARKTLAGRLRVSEDTLDRLVKELVAAEALLVVPRFNEKGDRTSNDYQLADARGAFGGSPHMTGGVPASNQGTPPRTDAAQERVNLNESKPLVDSLTLIDGGGEDDSAFEEFWLAYPKRDGKRLEKGKATAQWRRLSRADRLAAMEGVEHYAASGRRAKDAYRWLRDRLWVEWVDGAGDTEDEWHEHEAVTWMKRQQEMGPLQ
jgi:hypothetical protein